MVFDEWRARRRSIKEIHSQKNALREEHFRLREIESKLNSASGEPPSYGAVVSLSKEGVTRKGTGKRTNSTSGVSGMAERETLKLDSTGGSQTSQNHTR
ncbi:hypothetical protein WAI453_008390 [Rhynchosporium graminicola]